MEGTGPSAADDGWNLHVDLMTRQNIQVSAGLHEGAVSLVTVVEGRIDRSSCFVTRYDIVFCFERLLQSSWAR